MFRRLPAVLTVVSLLLLGACSSDAEEVSGTAKRPTVVAAFYPLAWMAARVGGDLVNIVDLTPGGAEPHDLELDADGVEQVGSADIAMVMGRGFQPAVEAAAGRRDGHTIVALDVVLTEAGNVAQDEAKGGVDAHVWLDPVLMAELVPAVERELTAVDGVHAETYTANAAALTAELRSLDADFSATLGTCTRKDLVTSHAAFGRLAARYGLLQEGIAGFAPDAEPDPKRLAALADLVKERGVTTVFAEELLPTKLADTLARETGAGVAVLSPLESLTDEQRSAGHDYLSVMRANLTTIAAALGCAG